MFHAQVGPGRSCVDRLRERLLAQPTCKTIAWAVLPKVIRDKDAFADIAGEGQGGGERAPRAVQGEVAKVLTKKLGHALLAPPEQSMEINESWVWWNRPRCLHLSRQ
eukprot:10781122-Alexandrium_andersonii.AAC.1